MNFDLVSDYATKCRRALKEYARSGSDENAASAQSRLDDLSLLILNSTLLLKSKNSLIEIDPLYIEYYFTCPDFEECKGFSACDGNPAQTLENFVYMSGNGKTNSSRLDLCFGEKEFPFSILLKYYFVNGDETPKTLHQNDIFKTSKKLYAFEVGYGELKDRRVKQDLCFAKRIGVKDEFESLKLGAYVRLYKNKYPGIGGN